MQSEHKTTSNEKGLKLMIKILLMTTVTVILAGCSNNKVLTDDKYKQLGIMSGGLQKCFEIGAITPKTYSDANRSISYILNTWQYDQQKLNSIRSNAYSSVKKENCRQVEAIAHGYNSEVAERKKSISTQNSNIGAPSYNSNINCKKLGEFINPEIKTFANGFCPIGWIKA